MHLVFADLDPQVINSLEIAFRDVANSVDNIQFIVTDIGQACRLGSGKKTIINAGNSASLQDGNIDGAISYLLSTPWQSIEKVTQKIVDDQYWGQLPIGSAVMVPSPNPIVSYMIYAPTMLIPENVSQTYNAYLAFRAALVEIWRYNRANPGSRIGTLICSGLATGAGEMDPITSAKQMRLAWDTINNPIQHDWQSHNQHHNKLIDTFQK